MIGSRVAATVVSLATVLALGGGAPRPEVQLAARRAVLDAADAADAAIANLRPRLEAALDAGRTGAALVVAGATDPPSEPLNAAAATVEGAMDAASGVVAARERLQRARHALDPSARDLPEGPDSGELASIAVQLRATAVAGDDFAAMRRRAEGLTGYLAQALADADAGDLDAARAQVATARSEAEALARWEIGAVTLPVWLDTVDAMIRAVDQTLDAIARGDTDAAEAAAESLAALAEQAPSADRALRIAMGESGSAVTAGALGSLAEAAAALDQLAAAIGPARAEARGG